MQFLREKVEEENSRSSKLEEENIGLKSRLCKLEEIVEKLETKLEYMKFACDKCSGVVDSAVECKFCKKKLCGTCFQTSSCSSCSKFICSACTFNCSPCLSAQQPKPKSMNQMSKSTSSSILQKSLGGLIQPSNNKKGGKYCKNCV